MKIRKSVFWPTVIISVVFFACYMISPKTFDYALSKLNNLCTQNLGWFFLCISLFMVIISFVVLFSRFGKEKIGGKDAKPMLSTWNWFSIVLCTTIAAGLIFWGSSEPLYHLMAPPEFLNIEPGSYSASIFSMTTMFLHWVLTPYAIYTVPALMFAYAVYNQGKQFSYSSCMVNVLPAIGKPKFSALIDTICVFSTVMGMVASLGQGILSVAGGLAETINVKSSTVVWTAVGVSLVIVFTLSACSGVLKGIKWISNINITFLIIMMACIFLLGPTTYIVKLAFESAGVYIDNFFTRSLMLGSGTDNTWSYYWTVSTFANWAAWAPITGMFLGKIAYGQSVRKFILINFVASSVCSGIWVSIFGGTAIHMQIKEGVNLYDTMLSLGTESAMYEMLKNLPLGFILIPLLVISVYLSFVTAADSTTNALGDLCCTNTETNSKASSASKPKESSLKSVKAVWGILIGLMAIILISSNGIAGIKMLSVIAGFPAIILLLISGISLLKVTINYKKTEEKDYEKVTHRNGL